MRNLKNNKVTRDDDGIIIMFKNPNLLKKRLNAKVKEAYMGDFILNMFADIADIFINLWIDKIINKFTSKK